MKLIKCHIENYGKLHNADYTFSEDITQFCAENGYGKTTLASFIKAMFYGLPSVKSGMKDFNDRRKFYPFNGGKFGGSLTFEMEGNEYRIERFFDKKSETKDECTVYCNNRLFGGFGEDIGKAVFGLDKDSFERTVFIGAEEVEVCATSSINAKLNNCVDGTGDGAGFEEAVDNLEKAKKRYKALKGNNDLISAKQTEIARIQTEIGNIQSIADGLEKLYSQSAKLKSEIAALEKRREQAAASNQALERWSTYEAMLARAEADGQALDGLEKKYPDGIPSKEQIASMKDMSREIIALTGQKRSAGFDEEKRARLEKLSEIFSEGVPDEGELQSIQRDIDGVKEAELKINSQKAQTKREKEIKLEQSFGRGIPLDGEVEKAGEKVERYRTLDRELKITAQPAEAVTAKKPNKLFIILAAVGALLAVAGIGVIFVNAVAGGVILGVGVIGLLAVGFLYLKNMNAGAQPVRINENAVKIQAEMKGLEEEVRQFLVPYSYYSVNGIVFDFAAFSSDLQEYKKYKEELTSSEERLNALESGLAALTQKLNGVFSRYGLNGSDLHKNYISLQTAVSEYSRLLSEKERAETGVSKVEGKLEELQDDVNAILTQYKITLGTEGLEELEKDSAEMQRLKIDIQTKSKEAQDYAEKFNLTHKPEAVTVDITAIAEEIKNGRREEAALNAQIAEDESLVEQLDDKKNALEEAEEKLKEYKERHKILSAAIEMLKTAESNLKEKYVSPIKEKFLHYADMIESALGERVSLDRDLSVAFERGGENRSDRHLSSGQRSICALCMRIALIDNIFESEKPFIIMDDPFVSLDEEHMQKTAQTVKALAKDKQIIYFCCHESRKIN